MIYDFTDESSHHFAFRTSRSADQYFAWRDEDSIDWIITRHTGLPEVRAEVWGTVREVDGQWWAHAGNLPDGEFRRMKDRETALEWITNSGPA